jgi:3,5-epimerase/4-reductase
MSAFTLSTDNVYLILGGKTGWIGGKVIALLEDQGAKYFIADSRTQNRESLEAEIEKYKPTHVLNCAGVTGRPNVDWCETNKKETIRTNVIGVLNVADLCAEKNIHHLLYATGCIFEYDDEHVIGGTPFTEESIPNFHGSFYSHTKALVEDLLANYPTTCTLRVRMPISDDLSGRNFITKIVKYDKVVDIPNSMTVLTDLLPISLVMADRKLTGIYNFCNPGAISHNECLELYKKYVDKDYKWSNFSVEEQAKVIVAARSNNTLCHKKICDALPDIVIPEIHESMERCMQRTKVNLEKQGIWPDNLPKRA